MEIIKNIGSNEINNLVDTFSEDEHLKDFYNFDTKRLEKMSINQYWYCMRLWNNNNYLKLKSILDNFLKHK